MSNAYYNENNPFSAEWLRELIRRGVIEDGEVDERDIRQVRAADLQGFTSCHFFAGIGVWSYALREAGWPKDEPVWTGSCPCQPFSVSGNRRRASDERHLWPVWFNLIRESHPEQIFGEQVASDDGLSWLDLVSTNLENENYVIGAVDTCAAGFGAPQISQRLYFVAEAGHWREHKRLELGRTQSGTVGEIREQRIRTDGGTSSAAGELAATDGRQPSDGRLQRSGEHGQLTPDSGAGGMAATECDGRRTDEQGRRSEGRTADDGTREAGELAATNGRRCEQRDESERGIQQPDANRIMGPSISAGLERLGGNGNGSNESGRQREIETRPASAPGPVNGFWRSAEWLYCRDGKYRPTEPSVQPLAHGIIGRLGRLRGYGNALVAPQAITFIKAYLEISS